MKSLSVAITVRVFPNIYQTYILTQLATLKEMGVNVSVIADKKRKCSRLPELVAKSKLLDDTIYINTKAAGLLRALFSQALLNKRYRQAATKLLAADSWKQYERHYRLKSIIRARAVAFRNFDIIHSHSMFSSYHYLFMKDFLSIPLVTTYHGQVPRGVDRLEVDKLETVLEKGDLFLVNTNFAKNELIESGCPAYKIRIIPQGINTEDFCFKRRVVNKAQKIVLVTVGRLSIEKGHHIAIEAIGKLTNDYQGIEYHIVGDGPDRQRLSRQVTESGLDNSVVFHGFKSGSALQKVLSSAHIFVLPSITTGDGYLVETQGVVLQEAQASGIPVIGSRTGGIPDVIRDNETGLLFSEGNPEDLANKVINLIEDAVLYKKIAETGRKDVEKVFDSKVVCNQLISVYKELVQQQD